MKPARIIAIAVAAVAAIGLALIIRALASGTPAREAAAEPAPETPTVQVLVASRDLNIGDRLSNGDMQWRAFPDDGINPLWILEGAEAIPTTTDEGEVEAPAQADRAGDGATAQVERTAERLTGSGVRGQLTGAVVRERIMAGEPIVARKLVRAGQSGYLAVVLEPGMRAMAVSVSAETGAGGFILPGDRVDVIMSRRADQEVDGVSGYVTATVLQNIRVLAMGEVTEAGDEQVVVAPTATLEVGARDAELLAFAQAQGDIYLVLRSYADSDQPSGGAPLARRETERHVRVFRNGEASIAPVR